VGDEDAVDHVLGPQVQEGGVAEGHVEVGQVRVLELALVLGLASGIADVPLVLLAHEVDDRDVLAVGGREFLLDVVPRRDLHDRDAQQHERRDDRPGDLRRVVPVRIGRPVPRTAPIHDAEEQQQPFRQYEHAGRQPEDQPVEPVDVVGVARG